MVCPALFIFFFPFKSDGQYRDAISNPAEAAVRLDEDFDFHDFVFGALVITTQSFLCERLKLRPV
jgi:hypothetical protein